MRDTFRGGVHPRERKELSKEASLRVFDAKGEMVFPLAQHIGKPAKAIVKNGQIVVSSPKVAQPVAVRYCFKDFEIGTLIGGNGLPVIPFRAKVEAAPKTE